MAAAKGERLLLTLQVEETERAWSY